MSYQFVIWGMEDDFGGNVEHIREHGVTQEEAEQVLHNPDCITRSESTGNHLAFGFTRQGRYLAIVFDEIDADTAIVITAYEPNNE